MGDTFYDMAYEAAVLFARFAFAFLLFRVVWFVFRACRDSVDHPRYDRYVRKMTTSVILFQVIGMGLYVYRGHSFDVQALILLFAMPLATFFLVGLFNDALYADSIMLLLVLLLLSISVILLKDIIHQDRDHVTTTEEIWSLCGYILIGFALLFAGFALMRMVDEPSLFFLLLITFVTLGALIVPFTKFGVSSDGAKTWIRIGSLSIQPQEYGKVGLVFVLSAFYARGANKMPDWRNYVLPWIFTFAAIVILIAQKEIGAPILYIAIAWLLFTVGTRQYGMGTVNLLTLCALGLIGYAVAPASLRVRVDERLTYWLDPLQNDQIRHAMIALSSGGAFGSGLGNGLCRSVVQYDTDFVFTSFCEEFGLVGGIGMILLYAALFYRGATLAGKSEEDFPSLLCLGAVMMVIVQAFVHIGGNVGAIPMTGVTLPLVSSGNNSILATMLLMGMALGVTNRTNRIGGKIYGKIKGRGIRSASWEDDDECTVEP